MKAFDHQGVVRRSSISVVSSISRSNPNVDDRLEAISRNTEEGWCAVDDQDRAGG